MQMQTSQQHPATILPVCKRPQRFQVSQRVAQGIHFHGWDQLSHVPNPIRFACLHINCIFLLVASSRGSGVALLACSNDKVHLGTNNYCLGMGDRNSSPDPHWWILLQNCPKKPQIRTAQNQVQSHQHPVTGLIA